eukprot:2279639-Rhodomonas_salina.1
MVQHKSDVSHVLREGIKIKSELLHYQCVELVPKVPLNDATQGVIFDLLIVCNEDVGAMHASSSLDLKSEAGQ